MKKVKRFCFGFISSALLAVGLARAADRFDPVMPGGAPSDVSVLTSTPDSTSDCTQDCFFDLTTDE
jgi:hypothetical protein